MARSESIIGGMTVLGIAGIICKLIGVLFSIPLAWIIGADGMGVFQAVFPTYNLLLTLSSAGIPVAISRMVSSFLAKDNPGGAKKAFRVALALLAALGCICTLVMAAGSGLLADRVNQKEAQAGFIVIAPCVLIVCVLAAFRGFMQGQQNMVPTAISQLVEQVGKVVISLPLAFLGAKRGIAEGAAGALLGITIVEAFALLYMVILYFRRKDTFDAIPQICERNEGGAKHLAGQLVKISIPITISACIVPLAQFVDSAMLVSRMMASGISQALARQQYGVFSGMVIRIINIPTALALSISMSLVPAISAAKAVDDSKTISSQTDLGMRFAFLIGFPCSVGMSLLSHQIMSFFYKEALSPELLKTGGDLLSMSALTIVLFTVVQATSAVLQGLRKQKIPMYTMIVGVAFKILLNYILVGIPGIDIHGGPVASIVCYGVVMVPNIFFVCKYGGMKFNWKDWVLRPAAATVCMGIAVKVLMLLLPSGRFTTIVMIIAGIAVYAVTAVLFKAVKKSDLAALRRRAAGKEKKCRK